MRRQGFRCGGVRLAETQATRGQPVERRRLHPGRLRPHRIRTSRIERHEQD